MSSPFLMLKKTRRIPLPDSLSEQRGRQKTPFKRNLLQEIQAEFIIEDSCDPNPPLSSHTNFTSSSKAHAPKKQGAPPDDFELMAAMMQRVTLLEEKVRNQAQEIERKERHVLVLAKGLSAPEESGSAPCLSCRENVERRCRLQDRVQQMEKLLSDYGLVWVGEDISGSAESEHTHSSGGDLWQTDTPADRGFHVNFDLVLQRIKELNFLTGEGEAFVQATASGAKLAWKDPVHLRLYSNGIVMFDGPFRSYEEHSTQQCMQDIMDGYFPSELQHRFPDGVPFEVHDNRHEKFNPQLLWDTFPGEGWSVCGRKGEWTNAVSFQLAGKIDQFLNKLPKMVVKAGRVIDIRNSLRKMMQGSSETQHSNSEILVDTPALQANLDRRQMSNCDKAPSESTVTLRVRSENGNQTYRVEMWLSETVGHLRSYLDKHRGTDGSGYDIISAYPRHSFRNDNQTLLSSGLSANATLLLQKRKHKLINQVCV
ncbi:UBX domain-containing protein 11 [Nematolebias whitei]|uniref:UBX domain-containing protein 11 n=1 Tax=Nematolebias whitei TaxID=451745 RepID=UPI0018973859|nr:UBX domain-containing protein 11 [Nematolebias whitei]